MGWILCPTTPTPPQIQMLKAQPPVEGFGEGVFKKVIKIKWRVKSGPWSYRARPYKKRKRQQSSLATGTQRKGPLRTQWRCTLSVLQKGWMHTKWLINVGGWNNDVQIQNSTTTYQAVWGVQRTWCFGGLEMTSMKDRPLPCTSI